MCYYYSKKNLEDIGVNNFDSLKEIAPKMVKPYNAKRVSIFFFDSPKKIVYTGMARPLECAGAFFIENNNGNPDLMVKVFCLHPDDKKLVLTGDIFYYSAIENMEKVYRKLSDFIFSSEGIFVFPTPTDKTSLFTEEIESIIEEFTW